VEEAAFTHEGLNHYDQARKLLEQALEISPKDYFARISLAQLPLFEKADLQDLRRQLNVFRDEGAESTANAAGVFIACALADRDPSAAEQALSYVPEEGVIDNVQNFLIPRDWFVGLVARTLGDNNRAQSAFAAARLIEAKITQDQPDYAPAWSMLGLIDAGLGRKTDAIAEGNRAVELLPLSKDSWEGPIFVTNLAIIYSWLGEKDLALEQLRISAQNPVGIPYGDLKLQPYWDLLRSDPRFQKIVATVEAQENAAQPQKAPETQTPTKP
jgi:serine/threonine-protein kinase